MDFYTIIHLLLALMLDSVTVIAEILSLDMRSNVMFYLLRVGEVSVYRLFNSLGMVSVPGRIVVGMAGDILLPVAMSRGDLRRRVARSSILWLGMIFTDLLGTSIYAVITGGSEPPEAIGPNNLADYTFVYAILLVVSAGINSMIVIAFRRSDGSDEDLSLPTVGLLVSSFFPLMAMYAYFLSSGRNDPRQYLFVVSYCWLAFIGSCVVLVVARREAASRREAAEAAVVARKTKHTRDEVEALAQRAEGMNSLRHALANDVRTVGRLAEAGNLEEAERHLLRLQELAHVLNGGRDE